MVRRRTSPNAHSTSHHVGTSALGSRRRFLAVWVSESTSTTENPFDDKRAHTEHTECETIFDDDCGPICACCVRSFVYFLLLFLLFIAFHRWLLFNVCCVFFPSLTHFARATASVLTTTICVCLHIMRFGARFNLRWGVDDDGALHVLDYTEFSSAHKCDGGGRSSSPEVLSCNFI